MRNLLGGGPEPDELVGREDLIEGMWNTLRDNNILLLGPRKFGKSGILRHLQLRPKDPFLPVSVYLEDVSTVEGFIEKITRELLKHDWLRQILRGAKAVPKRFRDYFAGAEVGYGDATFSLGEHPAKTWRELGEGLITEIEKSDKTVLFLLDEFPATMDYLSGEDKNGRKAREFLGWFRGLRLDARDRLRRCRYVLAGSIGIDVLTRRLGGTPPLNDLVRVTVGAISPEDARRMLNELARQAGFAIPNNAVDRILELLGPPVPYFVHLFFSRINLDPRARSGRLTPAAVGEIYDRSLLGAACRRDFEHYRNRLRQYGQKREIAAVHILVKIAMAGEVPQEQLWEIYRRDVGRSANDVTFNDLMGDLRAELYLEPDPPGVYRFQLEVMRHWWIKHYSPPGRRREGKDTP